MKTERFLFFLISTILLAGLVEIYDLKTSNVLYEKKMLTPTYNGWVYGKCMIGEEGILPEHSKRIGWVNMFKECDILLEEPMMPNLVILPFFIIGIFGTGWYFHPSS